jgi:RND superfamily putative drug exporter
VLERVARFSYRRRRVMLAAWLVALVVFVALGQAAGGKSSQSLHLAGTDSQQASDLLAQRFPARSGGIGDLVYHAPGGVASAALRSEVDALLASIARVPHVRSVVSPYSPEGASQASKDGKIAFAQIQFDQDEASLPNSVGSQIKSVVATGVHRAGSSGAMFELSGQMFQNRRPPSGTEAIGLLAAVVILLIAFGSVLAMGLPVMTALFGIGISLAGVTLLANVMSVPSFTGQLAAMIGIGVGIDYALFIVTRYRQGLHDGLDAESAVVKAITTSGRAVLFAGCTVVVSLAGLFLMGIDFVRGLAAGACLAVAITMLASVTLLPSVLGFVGHTIDRLRLPWTRSQATSQQRGFWYRWSRIIQRRPWPAVAVGFVALVALAGPVLSIRLGSSDASNLPTSDTTRRGYDLLSTGFGPGFNGPLQLAVEVPAGGGASVGGLQRLHDTLAATPGVASVGPARVNPAGDTAVMQVYPTTSPQDQRTVDLVHHLRNQVLPEATAGTRLSAHVGGITAAFDDVASRLSARLPLFIGAVLALSFLLLMTVFRSIVVPAKAVVMNLLSIGAAYGILVAVFQWGWGKGLFSVGKNGPVESFIPMILFAILFGLSMDYEVFLLSRVKEEHDRTGDNSLAVADGLSVTARVITAAAAIMVTVFGSFIFGDNRVVKEFGLGLAAAVLIDATLVRMVLVPATMEVLGEANWYLPRWLDRILPKIRIEGEPASDVDAELARLPALVEEPVG